MTDQLPTAAPDESEAGLPRPMDVLRERLGMINSLTQREVDAVLARLRARNR